MNWGGEGNSRDVLILLGLPAVAEVIGVGRRGARLALVKSSRGVSVVVAAETTGLA